MKQFAQQMVDDHSAGVKEALALATRLGVKPETNPTSKSMKDSAKKAAARLKKESGAESHALRAGHLRPREGDERRLGDVSHPDLPRRAAGGHRSDRPPEGEALGRRRADGGGGAIGDRECDLRRGRCAGQVGARVRSVPFLPGKVLAAI